jgi:transposase
MSVVSAAKLLKIGKSTLYRYLKQENEHGHLNPKENFKNGHSHKFKNLKKFERIASKNKSLTCPELAEKIGGISARTVSRYRHKIGYTRKKRPTQIRNKIIDGYRREAARPQKADFEASAGRDDESPLTLQEILPDLDNTPESTLLREAIWDEITLALDELPAEQREIFILNEMEERSFREIAEETGVSINTLLSRKRYAILALRKRLQRFYDDLTKQ